jgi:enoyl-CoA hydratase/carnithine racemase
MWHAEFALRAVEAMPIPVIAAARGAAVGAGCQLALPRPACLAIIPGEASSTPAGL